MTRAHVTTTAPWRRAPARLLRQPRLLAAAVLVAAVVGMVAATAVAGPSGSGKSTLLRLMALVERPTAGRVVIDGVDAGRLPARRRRQLRRERVAYAYQRPTDNLIEYLPAAAHLVLAAELRGATCDDPLAILDRVGLAHRADHHPFRLSGGEQQRLAFAAALASGAGLVVADEPAAQLDSISGAAVVAALRALVDAGATVLVCSHDAVVVDAGDHVVRLADGRVVP
jgi:ABC-type lipoprotein export system ATPase subunit